MHFIPHGGGPAIADPDLLTAHHGARRCLLELHLASTIVERQREKGREMYHHVLRREIGSLTACLEYADNAVAQVEPEHTATHRADSQPITSFGITAPTAHRCAVSLARWARNVLLKPLNPGVTGDRMPVMPSKKFERLYEDH